MTIGEIENSLTNIETVDDDKEFIVNLIMKKCTVLLKLSKDLIDQHKGAFIAPLLRQVFEYTIIVGGLDGYISLGDFIDHYRNDQLVKKIRDRMDSQIIKDKGKEAKVLFRGYTNIIFNLLSEHTHANVDNLVRFTIEEYSNVDIEEVLNDDATFLYEIIENFFFLSAQQYLQIEGNIEVIDYNQALSILKKSSDTKYNNKVYDRLLKIKQIKQRYHDRWQDIKKDIKKYHEDKNKFEI